MQTDPTEPTHRGGPVTESTLGELSRCLARLGVTPDERLEIAIELLLSQRIRLTDRDGRMLARHIGADAARLH